MITLKRKIIFILFFLFNCNYNDFLCSPENAKDNVIQKNTNLKKKISFKHKIIRFLKKNKGFLKIFGVLVLCGGSGLFAYKKGLFLFGEEKKTLNNATQGINTNTSAITNYSQNQSPMNHNNQLQTPKQIIVQDSSLQQVNQTPQIPQIQGAQSSNTTTPPVTPEQNGQTSNNQPIQQTVQQQVNQTPQIPQIQGAQSPNTTTTPPVTPGQNEQTPNNQPIQQTIQQQVNQTPQIPQIQGAQSPNTTTPLVTPGQNEQTSNNQPIQQTVQQQVNQTTQQNLQAQATQPLVQQPPIQLSTVIPLAKTVVEDIFKKISDQEIGNKGQNDILFKYFSHLKLERLKKIILNAGFLTELECEKECLSYIYHEIHHEYDALNFTFNDDYFAIVDELSDKTLLFETYNNISEYFLLCLRIYLNPHDKSVAEQNDNALKTLFTDCFDKIFTNNMNEKECDNKIKHIILDFISHMANDIRNHKDITLRACMDDYFKTFSIKQQQDKDTLANKPSLFGQILRTMTNDIVNAQNKNVSSEDELESLLKTLSNLHSQKESIEKIMDNGCLLQKKFSSHNDALRKIDKKLLTNSAIFYIKAFVEMFRDTKRHDEFIAILTKKDKTFYEETIFNTMQNLKSHELDNLLDTLNNDRDVIENKIIDALNDKNPISIQKLFNTILIDMLKKKSHQENTFINKILDYFYSPTIAKKNNNMTV